jgi:hypothetical protein
MSCALTFFKICCVVAVPVFVFAFLLQLKDGFFSALVNGLMFGGMIVGAGFVFLLGMADLESVNRPSITREEREAQEFDAIAGAVATDDKLWHEFWGD